MKNLEEKLEIMQWLYEQGVEPRMWGVWQRSDRDKFYTLMAYDNYFDIVNEPKEIKTKNRLDPWYPLEQVLELLPGEIQTEKYYFQLNIFKIDQRRQSIQALYWGLSDQAFSFSYDLFGAKAGNDIPRHGDDCRQLLRGHGSDFHLAALKLLKQVIEKYPESVG